MELQVQRGTAGLLGQPRRPDVLTLKFDAAMAVLAIREQELLDLKGPCSNKRCRLHYAHSGPCDAKC